MTTKIDAYFSLQSPWTWLGFPRLREIARADDVEVRFMPVDMGRIFKGSGGLPLHERPIQRQRYRLVDLARTRDFLGMPITLEPRFFPVNHRLAAGVVVAFREQLASDSDERVGALCEAILRAVWVEERDIADRATLAAICTEQGIDGTLLLDRSMSEAIEGHYQADTDAAIAAGVFGAPSFVLDGELFWGQDRIELLAWRLAHRQEG